MRYVRICQFNHRPSIKEAVALMRQERQGYGVSLMAAFEAAEAELLAQQQPQSRPSVVTQAPVEKVTPLRGLADSVACVDDEIADDEPIDSDEVEIEVDEQERFEQAADAALENPESREGCSEMSEEDSYDQHESNIEV